MKAALAKVASTSKKAEQTSESARRERSVRELQLEAMRQLTQTAGMLQLSIAHADGIAVDAAELERIAVVLRDALETVEAIGFDLPPECEKAVAS